MALFRVEDLPESPLAAAAAFHAGHLPELRRLLDGGAAHLTVVFASADHTHHSWRLSVVQGLAREYAPSRVNALQSDDEAAIVAAAAYLASAGGVTGQLLPLDGHRAGEVISVRT